MIRPMLVAAIAATTVGFSFANTTADNREDEAAIRSTVQNYFDGMMQGQASLLNEAFHEESRLLGPGRDGGLLVLPVGQWANGWEGRSPRDLTTHVNKILEIDIHGTAAVAKTELAWPNVRYIDYLSLIKLGDEWKIVNKIWAEESP